MDIDNLMPWLGRTERRDAFVDAWPVEGLQALLDQSGPCVPGSEAPLLSQWLYFGPTVDQSRIDVDGHPKRGRFLPPVELPRRMWAASDIQFHAPLLIGKDVTKTAEIADISLKQGESGALVFVKVANRYESGGTLLLEENQTLVYRDHPPANSAAPASKQAPKTPAWTVCHRPDETMVFRYSAVTFNAHRIHYDRAYATGVEGYAGVIVQGQLLATLMLEACKANAGPKIRRFSFRGVQPVFTGETVFAEGREKEGGCDLWIRDEIGVLRMSGTAELDH
ncbi:FAS1-like dehydratase domain-containing protein [Pseudotabrizicola algicola]|uniref:Acyl-CoA dehydrogenase n=1 Tax=Pseudotabrizicola algicola TaxID=2709381 RepID=A0A6B3RXL6_9RHOB|nr:MaoC family dehydratase N-terminal domain-containing protein [Pseudotabrizicola algicola]NEX48625.1 acyl-CoA dehydrogenase [Pseudotabrizicola algicola]